MKIDPNRMTKVKTKLRRIIKYNEAEPIAKAFHKWARNVQLLKLKDKDLYHAAKTIAGALRNNDKILNQKDNESKDNFNPISNKK